MLKKNSNTFYCFSPPVMIATFIIEFSLLLYTLWRYKLNSVGRVAVASLAFLAIFQFAEYHVCEGLHGSFYSRIGFMAITMLPPLGIHLIHLIAGKQSPLLVGAAYISGISFAAWFGLSQAAFQSYACTGNYAVFKLAEGFGGLYFMYYYFWLLLGIVLALYYSAAAKRNVREALLFQVGGYLSFVLPVGIVNGLHPAAVDGLPSVMCGFAVIYALTLCFGILPRVSTPKKQ